MKNMDKIMKRRQFLIEMIEHFETFEKLKECDEIVYKDYLEEQEKIEAYINYLHSC